MRYVKEKRRHTKMQFQVIAVSLAAYNGNFNHLPFPVRRSPMQSAEMYWRNGDGDDLYSWRVELVPYLESWHGSWDKDKPWDSPANRELLELSRFYSYDESFAARGASDAANESFPETNALAITGPGTAFGDGKVAPMSLNDVPPGTILVVESKASGVPWPSPGDFDIRTMPRTVNAPNGKGVSSQHGDGFHVVFADKQVWFLSAKVSFETVEKFFKVSDAKKFDRESLLGPFALDRDP